MIGTTTDEILSRLVEQALGCGTYTGVRQHELQEEDLCEMCILSTQKHLFTTRCIECILGRPDKCQSDDRLKACGTQAGYRKHYHRHEPVCDKCKLARKTTNRHSYLGEAICKYCRGGMPERCPNLVKSGKYTKSGKPKLSGCKVATTTSYNHHYIKGEKPCNRCKLAKSKRGVHSREGTLLCEPCLAGEPEDCKAKLIRPKRAVCGTRAGWRGHTRRNEPVCKKCRAGNASYGRHYRNGSPLCVPCRDADPERCELKSKGDFGKGVA